MDLSSLLKSLTGTFGAGILLILAGFVFALILFPLGGLLILIGLGFLIVALFKNKSDK